jgi:hypothetical protein
LADRPRRDWWSWGFGGHYYAGQRLRARKVHTPHGAREIRRYTPANQL